MKKTNFNLIVATIAMFLFGNSALLNAQVTIGSLAQPKATLDVVASKTDGSTAEGIIAPHLTLAQLKSADGQYSNAQNGAIVYVTDVLGGTTTKTANINTPSYYYYDGAAGVWKRLGGNTGEEWFYMPSIVFDTSSPDPALPTPLTKDLYQEYITQLNTNISASSSGGKVLSSVPNRADFDYFITAYDASVFQIVGISNGVLSYRVIATATDATYINIVFKKKP